MPATATSRLAACVSAAVLGVGLSGCGTEAGSSSSPTASSSAPSGDSGRPGAPDCSEVWVVDNQIPRGYDGCNAEGSFVPGDLLSCSSGQRMVRFDDRYYGVLGGLVRESKSSLEDDISYREAVASCRA